MLACIFKNALDNSLKIFPQSISVEMQHYLK